MPSNLLTFERMKKTSPQYVLFEAIGLHLSEISSIDFGSYAKS